jgi:type II secretory pathway component PulF
MSEKRSWMLTQPEELALWTRRLATMLRCGVPFIRALSVLELDPWSEPLLRATRLIREMIYRGDARTLAKAFSSFPGIFPDEFITYVQTGESCGLLDQMLTRVADLLDKDLFAARTPINQMSRIELVDWCWRFSMLLGAGVPILKIFDLLIETTHDPLNEMTREMKRRYRDSERLFASEDRYAAVLTPIVLQLISSCETDNNLLYFLKEAAELLEREALLEKDGKLPLLPREPFISLPESSSMVNSDDPAITRIVDSILHSALDMGAVTIELLVGADFSTQVHYVNAAGEDNHAMSLPGGIYDAMMSRLIQLVDQQTQQKTSQVYVFILPIETLIIDLIYL